jgi:hypothetical protein
VNVVFNAVVGAVAAAGVAVEPNRNPALAGVATAATGVVPKALK